MFKSSLFIDTEPNRKESAKSAPVVKPSCTSNNICYEDESIPKLKNISTAQEFIDAERYLKKKTKWNDDEFVRLYIHTILTSSMFRKADKQELKQQKLKLKREQKRRRK